MIGKTAIITGGGSGIGRAAALRLAACGVRVCVVDLHYQAAEAVSRKIESDGGDAIAEAADVSCEEPMRAVVDRVIDRWGRLDIVFANAGVNGTLAPIEHMAVDEWSRTIQTNLTGTFVTVHTSIPHLKANGGSIIITSSINGNRVFSGFGMSAYSTTKAGQVAFMKMAALELAQFRIRVNAICPGAISTNIDKSTKKTPELEQIEIPVAFPEGSQPLEDGPGTPEQVAHLAAFLASDASSHITGTTVYIDGAESLLR